MDEFSQEARVVVVVVVFSYRVSATVLIAWRRPP